MAKNSITKITKKDLLAAVKVAENGTACTIDFKKQLADGKDAHCILGCVIEGVAKNRRKSYESTFKALDETTTKKNTGLLYGLQDMISAATGLKVEWIWGMNDSGFYGNECGLKEWQIETLTDFANAAK